MFRLIKIIFNAFVIVLAIIGFNAIGGQKYVEALKMYAGGFMRSHVLESAKKIGDFSNLNEEFQIDNTMTLAGYKTVLAEHKASGQKMMIIDSGKKPLLTQEDIASETLEEKLKNLSEKFKYQSLSIKDIKVTDRGTMELYGQNVPYAKFEAQITKFTAFDTAGMAACTVSSDGSAKLALAVNDKKKYSQLISNEFFKGVRESK